MHRRHRRRSSEQNEKRKTWHTQTQDRTCSKENDELKQRQGTDAGRRGEDKVDEREKGGDFPCLRLKNRK